MDSIIGYIVVDTRYIVKNVDRAHKFMEKLGLKSTFSCNSLQPFSPFSLPLCTIIFYSFRAYMKR